MAEVKIYKMTEEDKKFKRFSDKILSELDSQENITFDELVEKSMKVNQISREELEQRFDEITAFGFNIRKVPKFSCLLPYHIMYSDWTPENYRKDRLEMFAKYNKDAHYIISMGLCSQEFNTVSDRSIERFLRLTDTFEHGKKKVMDALENYYKERDEMIKEIDENIERLKKDSEPLTLAAVKQDYKERKKRRRQEYKERRKKTEIY